MSTLLNRATLAASLAVAVGVLAAGCERQPTSPAVARAGVAADAATIWAKQSFTFYANFNAPAACLGGPIHISGLVSGWWQASRTSSGQLDYREYDDFSSLTATRGDQTWTAEPGSHEIWNHQFPIAVAGTEVVVHEGRTRFLSDDGASTLLFRHSIHEVLSPDGTIEVYSVTFEADCLGAAG